MHGAEDISHALFKCDRAMAVSKALGLKKIIVDATKFDHSGASDS